MRSFYLPKKIRKRSFFKILFLFSFLVVLSVFIKNNYFKEDRPEVLAATVPFTPTIINEYYLKNNIRSTCRAVQPKLGFSCVNSAGSVINMPEKEYYANPKIEELQGEPVVFFYGGAMQVIRGAIPRVELIDRFYNTSNNLYAGTCNTGYSPSEILNYGTKIIWGSGGLQENTTYRCMNNMRDANGFPSIALCAQNAAENNIPLLRGCVPNAASNCYDPAFSCTTYGGFSQYWNISHITRLNVSKSGGKVVFSYDRTITSPKAEGFATADADTYCFGKRANGSCTEGLAALDTRFQSKALRLRAVDIVNQPFYINYSDLNLFAVNNYVKSGWKTFYKRSYFGFDSAKQGTILEDTIFGGVETPFESYNLGSAGRVDFFQYANSNLDTDDTKNQVDKRTIDLSSGLNATSGFSWEQFNKLNPNFYNNNVIADYVSDRYFYSVNYAGGNLYVTRFRPTGIGQSRITLINMISLPVSLPNFVRPHVSFAVTSDEDLDIMIAPNFTTTVTSTSATPPKVFRATKFNASPGVAFGALVELTNLTAFPGGYRFVNPGDGNNFPITMAYFNTNDGATNKSNDYAVFVSKNYVYTSGIPGTDSCVVNTNNLSIVNTNPNSINNGIVPNSIGPANSNFNLNFRLASPLSLNCGGTQVPIAPNTAMTLTLKDPFTGTPVITPLVRSLAADGINISYNNLAAPSYGKYVPEISFNYNGVVYTIALPSTRNYFTLEGFLTVNVAKINPDGSEGDRVASPDYAITRTLGSVSRTTNFIGTGRDVLNNRVPTFFWDHQMARDSAGNLIDQVGYRICLRGEVESIQAVIIDGEEFTTSFSSDYLRGSISGNCLINLRYKVPNPATNFYDFFPSEITILVKLTSAPPTDRWSIQINGNVFTKNPNNLDRLVKNDKKYQGIYVSVVDKGEKSFRIENSSEVFRTNFKIPYVPSLSKAEGFEIGTYPDDVIFSSNYVLFTDNKQNIGSPSTFKKIDAFSLPVSFDFKANLVYLAKSNTLEIDLKDDNVLSENVLNSYYFVSTDSANSADRIKFKIDCSSPDYSIICGSENVKLHLKSGLYGNLSFDINSRGTRRTKSDFLMINYDPSILLQGHIDLRNNKVFNFTKSKTIFKYLGN